MSMMDLHTQKTLLYGTVKADTEVFFKDYLVIQLFTKKKESEVQSTKIEACETVAAAIFTRKKWQECKRMKKISFVH